MRSAILIGAAGLALLLSVPAMACGGGTDGAAMCGSPGKSQAKLSKAAPKSMPAASSKAKAGGCCGCCKSMAMMKGMDGQKDMPGMDK